MALTDKDQRFIRHMEADDSLHDADRLKHYVTLKQQQVAGGNASFGNADLERYYRQTTGTTKAQLGGVATAPKPPTPQPQKPTFDPQAYMQQFESRINDMYNQQRQAQLAQLRAQRDKAIGQINQQKAEVAPQYQGMRNQTDAMNLQNVQKLREVMANAGLTASGENVSANVAMNNERVNSINSLNLQEQQTMNDFNRRITDLNNPADENALMAQLEAERARALLDLGMRADEIGYSRSRDSEMDSRYYDERDYSRGRDSIQDGRWNQQWDYQKGRDAIEDARWREQFEYGKYRDTISDQQRSEAIQFEKQKFASETAWRQHVYNNMSASEKAQMEWNKQQFGEEMAWRIEENNRADKLARDRMEYDAGFQTP
ncbi:hypothetical protein ACFYKX_26575 [Cytobacillus sp. FJAT-54145]|uniref:Uncharacterized protein n=1 Tax=Cytobacillus spartinae TaxID=3299023 RepID=A0ABW6KKN7_9BACI